MAVLDKGLKQRIVGALVLVALAVIFVPMLFSRPDDVREVVVEVPAMPVAPPMPPVELETVVVPEPEPLPEDPLISPAEVVDSAAVAAPSTPVVPEPTPASRLDANSLPVSWSVQLASLSSRAGAETLQQTLRSKGYNAYIRTFDGMNRVFVGPVIKRDEAERLRDQLNRQQKLNGFLVRFQPEAG